MGSYGAENAEIMPMSVTGSFRALHKYVIRSVQWVLDLLRLLIGQWNICLIS